MLMLGTVDNAPPPDHHLCPPVHWSGSLRPRDPGGGLVQGGDTGSQGQDQAHLQAGRRHGEGGT